MRTPHTGTVKWLSLLGRQVLEAMNRLLAIVVATTIALRTDAAEPKGDKTTPYSAKLVKEILADANAHGDARRRAAVSRSPPLARLPRPPLGSHSGPSLPH